MANITTSQVADSTPTIVAAQALGYLKANTVLARLVNRDYENEVAQYGNVVKIPYGGSLSVNDKSGGSVVTLQQPDDAVYTLTLNKHKEVSFLIEDLAKAFARPDWFSVYAADAMAVLAEQIDADIAALYSGLSQTIDATAGLSEGTFREARRLLNSAKAPLENRVAVLHEDAEYEMLGIEKVVNRDYAESLGSKAAGAFTGRFMGFDVFLDQKIVATGGLGGDEPVCLYLCVCAVEDAIVEHFAVLCFFGGTDEWSRGIWPVSNESCRTRQRTIRCRKCILERSNAKCC